MIRSILNSAAIFISFIVSFPACALVVTDGDFSSWLSYYVVEDDLNVEGDPPKLSQGSAVRLVTGGNPGAYFEFTHTIYYGDIVYTGGIKSDFSYDPAIDGEIGTLSFSADIKHTREASGWFLIIEQAGRLYYSYGGRFTAKSWINVAATGLSADNIATRSGDHPDFSAAGAPIKFGFMFVNNITCCGSDTITNYLGLDNFSVSIYPPEFKPSFYFEPKNKVASENDGQITFTVRRTDASTYQTVYVSTVQNLGSANDDDYAGKLNEQLNFAVGVDELPVRVTIYDDLTSENQETFGLIIQESPTDPVSEYLDSASFTIQDNDWITPPEPDPSHGITVSPLDVVFAETSKGMSSDSALLSVRNSGETELTIYDMSLTGADAAAFDLIGFSASGGGFSVLCPKVYSPGQSCDYELIFSPYRDGQHNAVLTIDSSAGTTSVELSGTGGLDTDGDGISDKVENEQGTDPYKWTIYNYLALGDSFSSGEGVGSYKNTTHNHDRKNFITDKKFNLCARSVYAYSSEDNDNNFLENFEVVEEARKFYACAGAEIRNVLSDCQDDAGPDDTDGRCYYSPDHESQLAQLRTLVTTGNKVGLATITIGGNDMGFSKVLSKCVFGVAACEEETINKIGGEELVDWLNGRLGNLRGKLANTYTQIKNETHGAPLFVLGYPKLIHEIEGMKCQYSGEGDFSEEDVKFLNNAAAALNHEIACAAKYAGAYYVDVSDDSKTTGIRGLCHPSGSEINGLFLGAGGRHFHESFHPNRQGHKRYAKAVDEKIKELIGKHGAFPITNPEPEIPAGCNVTKKIEKSSG